MTTILTGFFGAATRDRRPATTKKGFTAVEILTVVAILGVTAAAAVPAFATYRRRASLIAQATQVRAVFRAARMRAITRNANAGVRFSQRGSGWMYALYDDGDGDGVRADDIAAGIDRCFKPASVLLPEFQVATVGVLPMSIRDPDGDLLTPASSPVQFGRTATCSFSPTGTATPGTIYLVSGDGMIYAVRVLGASGKVRALRYDAGRRRWVTS
jgi:prepilin-type N-terminal cleavage/methylation domain-containing protein